MLSKLIIKNVALIENAEISFGEGLNVLSGETGAGKSVILDSVNFVLGAKADRSMIRYGETECLVKAEFLIPETSKAVELLREMDIDSDGEVIISRKYAENGKNAIKINGNTVTAAMLRTVTDSLVDVHGQSEHFFLLKESNQLKTLDGVVGSALAEKKTALSELLKRKRETEERIAMLGGDEKERGRRIDVLAFQIEEIETVDIKEGEEEELLVKRNKIANLEKIITAIKTASDALSGEAGALDALRVASRAVSTVSKLDETYAQVLEKLENVAMETEDVSETLTDFADELYFDENEAEETEKRLDAIRGLKRKYGAGKQEIDEYLAKIKAEYELLSDCEGQYAALTAEREKLLRKIYGLCKEMTTLRKDEGFKFCARVTEELKTLNIPHAQFAIDFAPYEETDAPRATVNGLDEICFLFSANAGEPMKPLGKIISGGEMSRFMLAIKTQLSDVNQISTYIFDEIDAGISGKTAKVVGEKLAKIAASTQIIAVSHLAQIAAMSDFEYLIEKSEENGKTRTHVFALDENAKRLELVRLLGGGAGDEFALKHAEELLKQAKEYKKGIS
ncbi:MAG: DNA repair protein RecN [Clostridia bacterium]|nr:DNA repair protein RecN [Clostridia bacterium]